MCVCVCVYGVLFLSLCVCMCISDVGQGPMDEFLCPGEYSINLVINFIVHLALLRGLGVKPQFPKNGLRLAEAE